MNDMRIALLIIKILLTVAFVAAGAAKLIGAPMMVESYEVIGLGQWFRYLTGIIEVGGAVLLWIPRRQALGRGSAGCDNGWGCARSLGGSGHEHRRAVDRAGTALRLCSVVAPKGLPGAVPMGLSPA